MKNTFRENLEKAGQPCETIEEEPEEINKDENKSSENTDDAAKKAGNMHKIHMVYERYYVSFMRVRYAWCIFSLLIFWLCADIVALIANATQQLNTLSAYSLVGAVFGFWIGGQWGYACRNQRGIKDVKAVYRQELKSSARLDLAERNIQLRVWRSVGSVPICLGCTLAGGASVALIAHHFFIQGSPIVPFHLSDTVLITLISTTTASVIGIFLIVLHWLFPKEKDTDKNFN